MSVAAGQRAYQLGWEHAMHGGQKITFEEGVTRQAQIAAWNGGLTYNGDATAALAVGTAALLGLVARQRTGVGQYMETTMLCSNAYPISDEFFDYAGKLPSSAHDENGVNALYRLYPTAEGWVFLAAPLPSEWAALCQGIRQATVGASDLSSDPRFANPDSRHEHDGYLAATLANAFVTRPASAWEQTLAAVDIACPAISQTSLSEFTISSPAMTANGFVDSVVHPLFGPHLRHGPIVTLSRTPGVSGPGSLPGQHTRSVLAELGYSEPEIQTLRNQGIVGWPDGPSP